MVRAPPGQPVPGARQCCHCQHILDRHVDDVNTLFYDELVPPLPSAPAVRRRPAPRRKPRNAYHHGNLRQALVDQAVRTIHGAGVEALTLRDVGASLGVSRTALYRHFADKTALLAAVATDGFRALRAALQESWDAGGHGRSGFEAQGLAYMRFALDNPGHYRVMFGGFVAKADCDPDLTVEASGAFGVLLAALRELQQQQLVRAGDPEALALFVWSTVHGVSMLGIDGQLARPGLSLAPVMHSIVQRIWDGIAARHGADQATGR
jgi:AcrR family transcriptional regulator